MDDDLEFYIDLIRHLCRHEGTFEKYKKPYAKLKDFHKMIKKSKSEFLHKMEENTLQTNDLRLYERLITNIVSMAEVQKKKTFKFLFEDLFEYISIHLKDDLSNRSQKYIRKARVLLRKFKERLTQDLQDPEYDYIRGNIRQLDTFLDKELQLIFSSE